MASTVVLATQKTDKAANMKPQPDKQSLKELDDAVVSFLRMRMEWGRQISHVQAKLQGKAQEIETVDCYLRSQPRLGRKRKRNNNEANATGNNHSDKTQEEPGEAAGTVEILDAINAVATNPNNQ
jgi:hypothetical protein